MRFACASRTACGVDPLQVWNARTKELRSSRPSRNEISVPDKLLQDGKLVATAVAVCSIVQLRAG
jgi:hypothetical protein